MEPIVTVHVMVPEEGAAQVAVVPTGRLGCAAKRAPVPDVAHKGKLGASITIAPPAEAPLVSYVLSLGAAIVTEKLSPAW